MLRSFRHLPDRRLWPLGLILLVALCLPLIGTPTATIAAEDHAHAASGEERLHDVMEQVNDTLRDLRRSLMRDAASSAESIAGVTRMQHLMLEAKDLTPAKIAASPADRRAAMTKEYRKQMCAVIAELCRLEVSLLDGDTEQATRQVRNLLEMKATGHDQFRD